MPRFYTKSGDVVKNPQAYAETGAPMFDYKGNNINKSHTIYKVNCENGKKYIGKTTDIERRIHQHIKGNGAKVTQKFKPKTYEIIDEVPGFFSSDAEQYYTEKNIKKYGYENVRGGTYTNSKTLHRTNNNQNEYHDEYDQDFCTTCGRNGHNYQSCYAKKDIDGNRIIY